jgi:hypothetical protein
MWEDIDNRQATKADTLWIAESLKAGSLKWATDGSYNRKQVADLSGMGWIIFCKKTGFWLTESFGEKSSIPRRDAWAMRTSSSRACYHGISQHQRMVSSSAVISCDNKRTLEL